MLIWFGKKKKNKYLFNVTNKIETKHNLKKKLKGANFTRGA